MILTKKHIGKLFDVRGGDGSWCYELVAIKGKQLLFTVYSLQDRYEIDSNKYKDWEPFEAPPISRKKIKEGWKTGRVSPCN